MIKINLIKTQVPTKIDLPKKKKSPKFIIKLALSTFLAFVLLVVGVYFVFIKGSERIEVKKPLGYAPKSNLTNRVVKESSNQKVVKINKNQVNSENKKAVSEKEKKKTVAAVNPAKSVNSKKNKPKKTVLKKEKKVVENIKNRVFPVFSLNIKLSDIPKPIKKNNVQNSLYNEIIADNSSLDNLSTNAKKGVISKKQANNELYVKVRTKSLFLLKKYLGRMKIKYKVIKEIYRILKTYDIFVGGFDSYPKLAKFALDLKSKGYVVYKVVNMNLLFYVCIDKNVSESMKNRYIAVWSKTPFRIIAVEHKKTEYIYVFKFRCNKKQFKLLKKRGYYPIILSHKRSGA